METICKTCGNPVYFYPSNPHKYCSKQCCYAARKGSGNPAFKGGKVTDKNGYVRVRGKAPRRGCYEHQQVMEKILGRRLNPGEEIHHLNGVKDDNRPENLFLVDKRGHSRLHFDLFIKVQRLQRENDLLRSEVKKLKEKTCQ